MKKPEVNVQWKGTDVCLDFQCVCSDPDDQYEFHIDGHIFGRFQCPRCGTTWRLSHKVKVKRDLDQGLPSAAKLL